MQRLTDRDAQMMLGRTDGYLDGHMGAQVDTQSRRWTHSHADGRMDGHTGTQMDTQADI